MGAKRRAQGLLGVRLLLEAPLLAALCLAACDTAHPRPEDRDLFERTCSRCHTLDVPLSKQRDLKSWRRTVAEMRSRGAQLSDDEAERVARYLAGLRPPR